MIKGKWAEALAKEFAKPYCRTLFETVTNEYNNKEVYPAKEDIFNAYALTPLESVKVVILGQDPYHEPGQAHGLSFSVREGTKIPPSLVNIYKELHDDLGCAIPSSGNLTSWAKQGVMLLNTVLTVRAHEANSHKGIGWEKLTDATIHILAEQDRPIVFIFWGSQAKVKSSMITNPKHLIITSAHPSPLSAYRGFFGSKPFSKCNDFLVKNGETPIDWQIG